VKTAFKFTERNIAHTLAFQLLNSQSVLVVPNCGWTGHEADLLIIEPGLRIIDVEIKISRADLKADGKKDKWWVSRPWSRRASIEPRIPRQWPDKVWKHYYALPESIWDESLVSTIPEASGIILLKHVPQARAGIIINVTRKAKPNREAKAISHVDAIDLARLASLRMWAALRKKEDHDQTNAEVPSLWEDH
jgi:hypothetical protein